MLQCCTYDQAHMEYATAEFRWHLCWFLNKQSRCLLNSEREHISACLCMRGTVVCHFQSVLRSAFVLKCDSMLRSGFTLNFLLLEIISGCLDVLGLPFFAKKKTIFVVLNEYCQSWWVSGYSDSPVVKNYCNVLRDEPKSPVYITCFSLSEAHCTGLILLWGRS